MRVSHLLPNVGKQSQLTRGERYKEPVALAA